MTVSVERSPDVIAARVSAALTDVIALLPVWARTDGLSVVAWPIVHGYAVQRG